MTGTVPSTTDSITALVTEQREALLRGDVAAVAACYTDDATSFDLRPPLGYVSPRSARVGELTDWLAGFDGPVRIEVRDLAIASSGDVAFGHSLNSMTATPMGSPAPFTLWYRATLGFRRVDGSWRIVHEHKSTPFHMDMDENYTFRAATDLQP
ncbi:MAG: YybH family protein [Jatrophihabitans sp.]